MLVLSVNIARERKIKLSNKIEMTGIFKNPLSGPISILAGGLAGDVIVSTIHHGGPDQAVYVYGQPDYDWWMAELGRELAPGTLGENLTISGLESASLSVGDRLRLGGAVLEVTAARIPCATLAARMEDRGFVKRFRAAERPGAFCRVITQGIVQAGDAVLLDPYSGATLTLLEMFRSFYDENQDEASIRRHLGAPIASRARVEQEKRLAKLTLPGAGG